MKCSESDVIDGVKMERCRVARCDPGMENSHAGILKHHPVMQFLLNKHDKRHLRKRGDRNQNPPKPGSDNGPNLILD